jgi:preprotein translocase subunit SecG
MIATYLLTTLHVIICLFLIIVVLLQSGKAADLAGAFGGMGSQTVFGPRGSATVLSKATTVAAILFMVTSLSLSIMATRNGRSTAPSLLDKASKPAAGAPAAQQKGAPPQPGQTAPVQVTPQQGPDAGKPQNLNVPVVPLPPKAQPPGQQK